jgi:hypothetical protein
VQGVQRQRSNLDGDERPQLLLGHRSLATTARDVRIATSKVCSTSSPLKLRPRPVAGTPKPTAPRHFWRRAMAPGSPKVAEVFRRHDNAGRSRRCGRTLRLWGPVGTCRARGARRGRCNAAGSAPQSWRARRRLIEFASSKRQGRQVQQRSRRRKWTRWLLPPAVPPPVGSALAKAASSGVPNPGGRGVPSFVPNWRPRRDSNPRPQD